ncbi:MULTISPECIES: TrbC/VirB2 family protein [unclassified Lysobacter]|uniref:TrbC/VirB2 family protein n=1 Tax=unclassified Lysobacter TaxID=2635362 RepID=UPI0006F8CD81|nr:MULTISPECIES: TrbC/VirB2 family protein [unclassified Lysobacter]KQZ67825.1 hypothetical protein ASD53_00415 [Lysobacter sp. Root559]KRA74706.1 hypothetical protein ASD78_10255 [Lysobacter sp. Root667]KRC38152.1 hypothetical protein ASE10_00770 [Lysobacter sp. Root76]KRD69476.1 hypothetical protein ASE45_10055 [Lysobacter sp. Root96]
MNSNAHLKTIFTSFLMATLFVGLLAVPDIAFAQAGGGADASGRVKGFINNLNTLLNIASVAVVTIAFIIAGYQIAFAHKRISDVAPILVGGFVIGAAAQLAKMIIPEDVGSGVMLTVLSSAYA